eukprot:m.14271 g.14271  ORF g.14271 m.14271 type:complete len:154 (+) comp3136_c0_seq1:328-789(+)
MSDPSRSAAIKAKMEARKKAREASGEAAAARQAEEANTNRKAEMKLKAKALGGELDQLLKEEKDRKEVQKKLAAGESPVATDYKLFQTLYAFKSDDPDDLCFEANEILRVYDWEDEWYEGEDQQGKRGYLPATYVREITPRGGGAKAVGGLPT